VIPDDLTDLPHLPRLLLLIVILSLSPPSSLLVRLSCPLPLSPSPGASSSSSRVISRVGRHLSTRILRENDPCASLAHRPATPADGENEDPGTMGRMLLLMSLLTRFAAAEVLLGDVDEPRK